MLRIVMLFWMLLAAALVASPATARDTTNIRPVPCIASDQDISEAELFDAPMPLDCRSRQTTHGNGNFWVLLDGISARSEAEDPLVLRTGSVWQDAVTLHIRYADGYIARTGTTSATTSRRIQLGALIQYDIPPRAAPVTAILAHVRGSANVRGVLLSPEIMPRSAAARSDLALAALYAGFLGLCLALLCYNFALWTAMRHRFQLAYCAMVVAMMAYVFSSSGALAWVWPAIDNNDRLRINYASLTLVAASAILFARHFFEARIFPSWLVRLTNGAIVAALAATTAMVVLAPWQIRLLDTLNSTLFLIMLLCPLPMVGFAFVRGSQFLSVFLLAWLTPYVFALLRVLSNLGIVGQHFWIDNSTVLAMSAEALLSAIAIAWRIRLLSHERDSARADESIARIRADIDPLTGLLNRRGFLAAAMGGEEPHRLMLVDIDGFKQINDQIGHPGGDEVLCVVAEMLRDFAPHDSPVARLGGEEFALLISAAAAEHISPAALLDEIRLAHVSSGTRITVSIGIAEGPLATEQDWAELYSSADRALYRAKRDGGGRFRMELAGAV